MKTDVFTRYFTRVSAALLMALLSLSSFTGCIYIVDPTNTEEQKNDINDDIFFSGENAYSEPESFRSTQSVAEEGEWTGSDGSEGGDIVFPENTEQNAVLAALNHLLGEPHKVASFKPEDLAPTEFWAKLEEDKNSDRDELIEEFCALRTEICDACNRPIPQRFYGPLTVGSGAIVDTYSKKEIAEIQEELYKKYGIPKSEVADAKEFKLGFSYVNSYTRKTESGEGVFTVVLIHNKWYLYDNGRFCPEIMRAVITSPQGGVPYLMNLDWLK